MSVSLHFERSPIRVVEFYQRVIPHVTRKKVRSGIPGRSVASRVTDNLQNIVVPDCGAM